MRIWLQGYVERHVLLSAVVERSEADRPRIMHWIYSAVIEPNLLNGVAFSWTALDKQYNVRLLDKVRRSAAISMTGTVLLAKQAAKFAAIRLNALSNTVSSGYSTILGVNPVTLWGFVNNSKIDRECAYRSLHYGKTRDLCRGCRSVEEEETDLHFFCQWPSLARCTHRLFGSPFLSAWRSYHLLIWRI